MPLTMPRTVRAIPRTRARRAGVVHCPLQGRAQEDKDPKLGSH
jgi:hypothetical protein